MRISFGSFMQPIVSMTIPLCNKRRPFSHCIHIADPSLSMFLNKKTVHNNYMPQYPRSVQPSAYLMSSTRCYSPCLQSTRIKRPQLSGIRDSRWFVILTLSQKHKSSPTFFQIIWFVALISYSLMLTCAIASTGDQSPSPSMLNEPFIDLFSQEQTRGHCVDSNGTLHALFTSWLEHSTCKCTCYPTARMAVSVCDGCVVVTPSPTSVATQLKINQVKPNEINRNQLVGSETEQQTVTTKRRSCLYTLTGVWYHHSEIWMSAKMPCVKCQQSLPPGPCCETICRGKALQNLSTNFINCLQPKTGLLHSHGEFITVSGSCVDQKCHCVNGRWNCLDYCTPLAQMPCQPRSVVIWDPFCCPRCPGTSECTIRTDNVHIDPTKSTRSIAELDSAPVSNSEDGDTNSITSESEGALPETTRTTVVNNVGPKSSTMTLKAASTPRTQLSQLPLVFTAMPGSEVALKEGHCFCLNATVLCPRPGRQIWHDDDCYYVDGHESTYYPPKSHWVPNGDTCTECRCVQNRMYLCAPRTCNKLFLCPAGQQPLRQPGECCPSFCGIRQKTDDVPPVLTEAQTWDATAEERPASLGQPSTKGNPTQLKVISNKSENRKATIKISTGCAPLGGTDQQQTDQLFPSGSRLVLFRPCRSLLCICAQDEKWVCTDYCPPCIQSVESIERLSRVPRPPMGGGCCPVCAENPTGILVRADSKATDFGQMRDRLGSNGVESMDYGQFAPFNGRTYDGLLYTNADRRADGSRRYDSHSNDRSYQSGAAAAAAVMVATEDHIRSSLKIYVMIATVVLFCLLGLPMAVFITWYVVNRKRKRRRQQYKVRLHQRKRQHLEAMVMAVRQRPPFAPMTETHGGAHLMSSTSTPNTDSSSPMSRIMMQQAANSAAQSYRYTPTTNEVVNEYERSNEEQTNHPTNLQEVALQLRRCDRSGLADYYLRRNHRTNETKSVPSSPVASVVANARPRRVKSSLKSPKPPLMALCKQEGKRVMKPRTSSQHWTDSAQASLPITPVAAAITPSELSSKDVMAVRRTASNVSTRQLDISRQRNLKTLTRASTWLAGARAPYQMFRCFTRASTTKRVELQSENEFTPNKNVKLTRIQKTPVAFENGEFPIFNGNGIKVDPLDNSHYLNDPFTSSFIADAAEHWVRHQNLTSATRPDTSQKQTEVSRKTAVEADRDTTVRHHFVHAHRSRGVAEYHSPSTISKNGIDWKPDAKKRPMSKSPETDNTSMTDSQTPLLETKKVLTQDELSNIESLMCVNSLEIRNEELPQNKTAYVSSAVEDSTKCYETCYTWPRMRHEDHGRPTNVVYNKYPLSPTNSFVTLTHATPKRDGA
ncbi:hypothetical protein AHF37_00783 [Paragonimus kellicotti]|nr:hypothetical protein AHF37_00783 [Paragonimus kellicotti]